MHRAEIGVWLLPSWRMLIDRALASEIRTGSGSLTRALGQSCGFATQKTAFMSSHRCSSRTHIARTACHPFQHTVQPPRHTTEKTIAVTVTDLSGRGDIENHYGDGYGNYSPTRWFWYRRAPSGNSCTQNTLPGACHSTLLLVITHYELRGSRQSCVCVIHSHPARAFSS